MEVMPVMEVRAVIDVAISVAHTTATEHGRGAKAATMDSNATASEPAAMERSTATSEPTAVESAAASPAAKPAASTTAKTTTAAAMTAMPDFGRQIVGCKFR
jgi:cell division septation protein DedD